MTLKARFQALTTNIAVAYDLVAMSLKHLVHNDHRHHVASCVECYGEAWHERYADMDLRRAAVRQAAREEMRRVEEKRRAVEKASAKREWN